MSSKKIDQLQRLINLSDSEQEIYQSLSEAQQIIFDLFRQAFLLSSGDAPTQGKILLFLYSTLNDSVQQTVDNLSDVPHYLQAIVAPKNHVRVGKASEDEQMETIRLNTIKEAFEAWVFRLKSGERTSLLGILVDFIVRDQFFVADKWIGDERKRATKISLKASFLREIVLDSETHTVFHPLISSLLSRWSEHIVKVWPFFQEHVLTLTEEEVEAYEVWSINKKRLDNEDLSSLSDEVQQRIRATATTVPSLVRKYQEHFGLIPTKDESDVLTSLYYLVVEWKKRPENEGLSFLVQ